jgi:hypothetical protein
MKPPMTSNSGGMAQSSKLLCYSGWQWRASRQCAAVWWGRGVCERRLSQVEAAIAAVLPSDAMRYVTCEHDGGAARFKTCQPSAMPQRST